ncbi:MAG: amino acid permease [Gemmataceae bacterium]
MILAVPAILTVVLLYAAPSLNWERLWTFTNFSGFPHAVADAPEAEEAVWPITPSIGWLFALGFLLPGYTLTGFDASAHVAEETSGAARNVPRGIVRSVLISAIFGWLMLSAIVLAMPDPMVVAEKGEQAFVFTISQIVPPWLALMLEGAIVIAQYLCGLATVTSASRMAYAFARDGGLPFSTIFRTVSPRFHTPVSAIWLVSTFAILFTVYAAAYATIAASAAVLLYISYVLPTAIGLVAYQRWWTELGPWHLGMWFRPLAVVSTLGCLGLIVIGMQPPNEKVIGVVFGMLIVLLVVWFAYARRHFPGPPPWHDRSESHHD